MKGKCSDFFSSDFLVRLNLWYRRNVGKRRKVIHLNGVYKEKELEVGKASSRLSLEGKCEIVKNKIYIYKKWGESGIDLTVSSGASMVTLVSRVG